MAIRLLSCPRLSVDRFCHFIFNQRFRYLCKERFRFLVPGYLRMITIGFVLYSVRFFAAFANAFVRPCIYTIPGCFPGQLLLSPLSPVQFFLEGCLRFPQILLRPDLLPALDEMIDIRCVFQSSMIDSYKPEGLQLQECP